MISFSLTIQKIKRKKKSKKLQWPQLITLRRVKQIHVMMNENKIRFLKRNGYTCKGVHSKREEFALTANSFF